MVVVVMIIVKMNTTSDGEWWRQWKGGHGVFGGKMCEFIKEKSLEKKCLMTVFQDNMRTHINYNL